MPRYRCAFCTGQPRKTRKSFLCGGSAGPIDPLDCFASLQNLLRSYQAVCNAAIAASLPPVASDVVGPGVESAKITYYLFAHSLISSHFSSSSYQS